MLSFTKADNQPNLSQGIEYTVVPGIEYTVANVSDYLLSPDGTQVAYIKANGDRHNCELWVADKSPCGAQLINHLLISDEAEYNGLDDWMGDWILYRIRREPGPFWGPPWDPPLGTPEEYYGRNELFKIRPDGTDKTQITDTFTVNNGIRTQYWNRWYDNRGTVVWGEFIPGTNRVYFQAHNGNGWYRSFVVVDDGLIVGTPSTFDWYHISYPYHTWVPRLSPTGNKLLYGQQYNHPLPTTFYSCNVDGSGTTFIRAFSQKIGVTVLADGNTLVWHQFNNLYAINMDGTNERTVLDDEYINLMGYYDPTDGQSLIMGSNRDPDGNMHLFKMNVDGTGIEQLTEGPYNDETGSYTYGHPTLSPDGLYLSYLRLPEDFVKEGYPVPYPYELVIKTFMIHATVDFDPDTLNRKSEGKWVTVYIEFPECDVSDIDIDSVHLDGLSRADSSPTDIGDHDDDGIPDLMVKFDRGDLIDLLQPGENVLITISGFLYNGLLFEGTDTIRVIH